MSVSAYNSHKSRNIAVLPLFLLAFFLPYLASAAITLSVSNVQQNSPRPSATFTLSWTPPAYTGPLTEVRTYLFEAKPINNGTAYGPFQEVIDA